MFLVAVLLGTLKALGLETVWLAIGASWVVITAAVRAAFGSTWAHVISAGGGGVLVLGLLFSGYLGGTSLVLFIILATGVPFVSVELAFFGIDWLDERVRTKPGTED
jgi:hypothetical protein